MTHHKRVICIVLSIVLFTSGQLLFADSRNLDLGAIELGVTRIEYRIGEGAWHEFDTDTLQILLPSLDANTTLVFRLYQEPEASSPEIEESVAAVEAVEPVTVVEPIAVAEVAEPIAVAEAVEPVAAIAATVPVASTEVVAAPAVPALMTFDLKAVADDVSRIEYRLGDDAWKDMDRESLQIALPTPADDTPLQLNLYGKKKKPVATYNYRYVEAVGNFINDDPTAIAAARASVAETVVPEATAEPLEAGSTADEVLVPVATMVVAEVAEPVAVAEVAEPVAVAEVAEPVAVAEVAEPVAVAEVIEPVVVAEVIEPVAVAEVAEPVVAPAVPALMTFDLKAVADDVSRIEYRLGDDAWKDMDRESLQIALPTPADDTALQLNLYGKKKKPIATYNYRYVETVGNFINDDPTAIAAARASVAETVVPATSVVTEVPVSTVEALVPVATKAVAEVVEPMAVAEVVEPVAVAEVVEPVVVAEVIEPVVVAEVIEPVVVAEVVEPIAVAEVVEPIVVAEAVEPVASTEAMAAPAVPALMTFDLKAVADDVSRIEYRLGDDAWKDMDRESLQLQLPPPEADTALQLNLYGKKKKPVATYNYRYVEAVGNFINDDPTAIAAARASVAETVVPATSVVTEVPVSTVEALVPVATVDVAEVVEPVAVAEVAEPVVVAEVVEPVVVAEVVEPVVVAEVVEPVAVAEVVEPVVVAEVVEPVAVAEVVEPIVVAEAVEPVAAVEATVPVASTEAVAAPAVPALMTFDLKAVADDVSRIEYRLGDDAWKDMDRESLQIALPTPVDDTALQLNLYGKKKKPIATYNYRYVEAVGNFINDDPTAIAAARASVAETPAASSLTEVPVSAVAAVVPASTEPVDDTLSTEGRFLDLRALKTEVESIEYSIEDDSWNDVDMDTMKIALPSSEDETTLLLSIDVGGKTAAAESAEAVPSAQEVEATVTSEDALKVSEPRYFDLRAIGDGANRIEYLYEDDPWRDVDMETLQIRLPHTEEDETILLINLHLGSREAIVVPVEEEKAEEARDSMEVTLSPYATAMLTDNDLRHMYTIPFGLGLDAAFTFPFHRNLVFRADAEVKFAISNNIWAKSFLIFGGDVGIGYNFELPAGFQITPSLSYGLHLHYWLEPEDEDEFPLTLAQYVGADVEVGYRINPSTHVFIAPQARMMIDKTRSGFLYGLRAGVGFRL